MFGNTAYREKSSSARSALSRKKVLNFSHDWFRVGQRRIMCRRGTENKISFFNRNPGKQVPIDKNWHELEVIRMF